MTRLASHARRKAPSGIDRVELAYARAALSTGRCAGAVIAERIGGRWLGPGDAGRLLERALAFWREYETHAAPGGAANAGELADTPAFALFRQRSDFAIRAAQGGGAAGAVYLRASHDQLDRLNWLARWPRISKIFFIHDILPVQWPEYFVAGEAARHKRKLSAAKRFGDALLVSSAAAAQDLRMSGLIADKPIHILPIGVESVFRRGVRQEPAPAAAPYFVMCGTLEPRKNHLLVLNLWRQLALTRPDPPRLVIVGRRGWENEAIVDMLERCDALRPYVSELSELPTPALANLLRGASALLAPSFAEGYGIPVLEALAVGAPVIASDIASHREIAGPYATFLDPLDGLAWRAAVIAAAKRPIASDSPLLADFEPPRWEPHIARLFEIIDALPEKR